MRKIRQIGKVILGIFMVVVVLTASKSAQAATKATKATTQADANRDGYSYSVDFDDGSGEHHMLNLPITDWRRSTNYFKEDWFDENKLQFRELKWDWSDVKKLNLNDTNPWNNARTINGGKYDRAIGVSANVGAENLVFSKYQGTFHIDEEYDMTGMDFVLLPVSGKYSYFNVDAFFFIYPKCIEDEISSKENSEYYFMNYMVYWGGTQMIKADNKFHKQGGLPLTNYDKGKEPDAFAEWDWYSKMTKANASRAVKNGWKQVKNSKDYDGDWVLTIVHGVQGNNKGEGKAAGGLYRYLVGAEFQNNQILYYGNGATSGEKKKQTQKYNETVKIFDNWFERDGYVFTGWNTLADGSGTAYKPGASYSSVKPIKLFAQWRKAEYTIKYNKNASDATGTMTAQTCSVGADCTLTANTFTREDYVFTGWSTTKSGAKEYNNKQSIAGGFKKSDGQEMTLYAVWRKEQYKIVFDGNGATDGTMGKQTCNVKEDVTLNANKFKRTNYVFTGWSTTKNGTKVYDNNASIQGGFNKSDGQEMTLYAVWKRAQYTITYLGNGATDGTMGKQTCNVGQEYKLLANKFSRTGYHFLGWSTSETGAKEYNDTASVTNLSTEDGANVKLYAVWGANKYTIRFHPNDGAQMIPIPDIEAEYDVAVTLPGIAGTAGDAYVKYTLDGRNVTQEVLSGSIPESQIAEYEEIEGMEQKTAEVAGEELAEAVDGGTADGESAEMVDGEVTESQTPGETTESEETTESDETTKSEEITKSEETIESEETTELEEITESDEERKLDAAELADNPDELDAETDTKMETGQKQMKVYPSVFLGWSTEDEKEKLAPQYQAGEVVHNLTAEDGGEVILYAVWDDCPWIVAKDLYYSIEQAQGGFITEAEILSHATASDREDGSPILPGFHENGTSFSIPDYQPSDFTQFCHDGSITENLTVKDSAGSVYDKQITVHIVDTTPQPVKPIGTTRFISEKYFHADYEHGGLEDNSIWKTNPEYRRTLQEAFDNLKNDTPEYEFCFTHETVLEMKQFIEEHGIGNSKEPDALTKFYEQFMTPNRVD